MVRLSLFWVRILCLAIVFSRLITDCRCKLWGIQPVCFLFHLNQQKQVVALQMYREVSEDVNDAFVRTYQM